MSTRQHGFTLVELILVLVVIGVLAAVVGPRFFDRAVFDERAAAEELRSGLRYAQKLAIASVCKVRLACFTDPDDGKYKYQLSRSCDGNAYQNVGKPEELAKKSDPEGFRIVFGSLGQPEFFDGNSSVSFDSQRISIEAETGYVR